MSRKSYTPWARLIGSSLAILQDGVDHIISWGFNKMSSVNHQKIIEKKPITVMGKMALFGKGILGFFGETGQAFYEKYEDLKKKEK